MDGGPVDEPAWDGGPADGIAGPVVAGTGDIGPDGTGTDGTLSDWTTPGGGIGPGTSVSVEAPAGSWPATASYGTTSAGAIGSNDGELTAAGGWAG